MLSNRMPNIGIGERWAIAAAVCYSGTSLLLRATATVADPTIAAILRLTPVLITAWALTFTTRDASRVVPGQKSYVGWKVLRLLILAGASSYFIGNNAYQLALRFGGIGVTAPVVQSTSLWSGIFLGSLLLGEGFYRGVFRGGLAVVLGLVLLAFGQGGEVGSEWYIAIPFAAVAGAGYASANLSMRSAYRNGIPHLPALAMNATSGMFFLLILAVLRHGPNFLAGTSPETIASLLAAGIFNAGALFSLSRALTTSTASRVNSINTGSIAFTTLMAAILFGEPMSLPIAAGIVLIIGGLILVQRYLAPAQTRAVQVDPVLDETTPRS